MSKGKSFKARPVPREESLIQRWLGDSMKETEIEENIFEIQIPARPLHDEWISIMIKKDGGSGSLMLSDDGETFGRLFVNAGLAREGFTAEQDKILNHVLAMFSMKLTGNDVLQKQTDEKQLKEDFMAFFTGIVQVYTVLVFNGQSVE